MCAMISLSRRLNAFCNRQTSGTLFCVGHVGPGCIVFLGRALGIASDVCIAFIFCCMADKTDVLNFVIQYELVSHPKTDV